MSRRDTRSDAATGSATWSKSFGEAPYTVHARERVDRGYTIWIRWIDRTRGAPTRRELSLQTTIRDEHSGRFDPRLRAAVEERLRVIAARVAAGLSPLESPVSARATVAPTPATLTLAAGFALAFDPSGAGKYITLAGRHVASVMRRADVAMEILGAELPWAAFSVEHERRLLRELADRHLAARDVNEKASGPRHAEQVLDTIFSTGAWLRSRGHIPANAAVHRPKWRGDVAANWQRLVKSGRPSSPTRLHHHLDEVRRLFAALDDPRLHLWRRLIASATEEAPLHAVAELTRADLDMIVGGSTVAAVRLVWDRQNRSGGTQPVRHRAKLPQDVGLALGQAMQEGYLQHLEGRFRATGENYHLFAEGALVDWCLPPTGATTPLTATADTVLLIDPRIELALTLGAELRLGQVVQTRRSALNLHATRDAPHGTFDAPGNTTKQAPVVCLTEEERTVVDRLLGGFLREYESAYDPADVRTDYALFPSGQLKLGVARRVSTAGTRGARRGAAVALPVARNVRVGKIITDHALLDHFHNLERAAGVEVVPGRGWYGVRRASVNAAERLQPDARVRNVLGGWAPGSETREAVYANHLDAEVAREAGATRQHIRHGRRSAGTPETEIERPASISSAVWAALSPESRADLVAAVRTAADL